MVWRVILLLVFTVFASGCVNVPELDDGASERGGQLQAEVVEKAPPNATVVNSTDGRIANVTIIQNVVSDAATNGFAGRVLNPSETRSVQESLSRLPYYSGPEDFGYYIKHDSHVIRLRLLLEE